MYEPTTTMMREDIRDTRNWFDPVIVEQVVDLPLIFEKEINEKLDELQECIHKLKK